MEIKDNKTRISLWFKEKRFAKIESNKLTITNGNSNRYRHLWITFQFNKLDDCFELLQYYLFEKNIKLALNEYQSIRNLYIKL